MVYIGITWNTIDDFKSEVINDIGEYGEVLFYFELDLQNKYDEFVRELYKSDGISEWKVNLKLEAMNLTANKRIGILFIKVDDEIREFNQKKNKMVVVNIENLKGKIRSKYSKLIPNYFFDNVFHMTDNEEELKTTLEILKIWFPEVYVKHQKVSEDSLVRKRERNNENK